MLELWVILTIAGGWALYIVGVVLAGGEGIDMREGYVIRVRQVSSHG